MNTGRGQNKMNWSDEEDRALIETLQEVAVDINWKSEKGWRDSYLVRVEELMAMKVPMAGLKANPHIESRWKYLKRKYHAIADMRASSGFGWDENSKKIQCDKSVYDEWCKSHKDARDMWGVSFPHFHALAELMGNDRATGSNAENFAEAIENMGNETNDSMFSTSTEEADQDSVSKPGKRKRSKDNPEKNLISMFDDVSSKLGSFMENIDKHLGKLVASESDDMAAKVMEALRQMEGLSGGQVLQAAEILMAEPPKLKP
ncbi:hypothetical protein ACET3Z_018928 [Daucus carota]